MAKKKKLTEFVPKKSFSQIEKSFYSNFGMKLEGAETSGKEVAALCSSGCYPQFCKIVRSSPAGRKRCYQDRLRGLNIAVETGQPYIWICHAGVVLACVPIMDKAVPLGGLFFGKCLWEQPDEAITEDIVKRLKGLRIPRDKLRSSIKKLPVFAGRKIHEATEFLFVMLYQVSGLDPHVMQWRRQRSIQQGKISELIQEHKKISSSRGYPFECEKQLIAKVKIGDRIGARDLLNTILAAIMLAEPGDLNVLKARMVELLSILSRSAAEGGVDINFLLERNLDYISKVMQVDNQPDLCVWIGNALNDFIEQVYSVQDRAKTSQVAPAMAFIEENYREPIALADIAKAAHLSVSRLAHVFKEQMSMTLIDYLTHTRIDKAKELLLSTNKSCTQICFEVGYNNQSYFTRTFKDIAGITPRQFREMNKRK